MPNRFDQRAVGEADSLDLGTGERYGLGSPGQGGTPAGPDYLAAGEYHADGNVSLPPYKGNYSVTLLFDDGIAGDQTTGVTCGAPGLTQTEVVIFAADTDVRAWAQTKKYGGNGVDSFGAVDSQVFSYWNASTLAWVTFTDTNGVPWPTQVAYAFQSRTATFAGGKTTKWYRCVTTISEATLGNLHTSDSRPSA